MKQRISSQCITYLRRIRMYVLVLLAVIAIQLKRYGLIPGIYCHKFVRWCTKRSMLEIDKLPLGFVPDTEIEYRDLKSILSMTEATIRVLENETRN